MVAGLGTITPASGFVGPMGGQVMVQLTGVLATAAWSGMVTYALLKLSDAVAGLRVNTEEETEGLDTVLHNEKGYNL